MSGRIETSDEHEDLQGLILSSEISILVTNRWSKIAVKDRMDNSEEVFTWCYFIRLILMILVLVCTSDVVIVVEKKRIIKQAKKLCMGSKPKSRDGSEFGVLLYSQRVGNQTTELCARYPKAH